MGFKNGPTDQVTHYVTDLYALRGSSKVVGLGGCFIYDHSSRKEGPGNSVSVKGLSIKEIPY